MSIVHADNFAIYGGDTGKMTNGLYGGVSNCSLIADPDGVSPGVVLQTNTGNGGGVMPLPVASGRVGMSKRVWLNQLPGESGARQCPFTFFDLGDGNPFAIICVEPTGALTVGRPSGGGMINLATTPGPVITANAWWHIEVAVEASTGSCEIRVEGVPVLDVTGLAFTYAGDTYRVGWSGRFGVAPMSPHSMKDFVVWDDNGTQNIDFLGAVIVYQLDPVSDVTIGGWVPSTGAVAWDILDTATPGEAPYVAADATPPAPIVENLSNLPADITSVKALVTLVRAKKVDGGDGNLQISMLSGGDASNGADRPITAAMTYWRDVHEIDPDTGFPWSPAAVDLATMQIDRTV